MFFHFLEALLHQKPYSIDTLGLGFLHASPNADCIEVYGGCMKKHIMITCIFVV